jgi:hypothetical protein
MVLYEQGTGLTAGYAWNNYAGAYTGPFLLFVHEVGQASRIKASDSTIVDHIQDHRNDPCLLDVMRPSRSDGAP